MSNETLIMNGGNPLKGCPKDWDEAKLIQDTLNHETTKGSEPQWRFDCGFKFDFDGPLVSVSSRFYPPKSHYGPRWDGSVDVEVMGVDVSSKKFDCETLEELSKQVKEYVDGIASKLKAILTETEQGND